jgi:hypothetical protein
MTSLSQFQRHLQDIYDLVVEHDVDDFLITSAELARVLDSSANPREIEEKLLVQEEQDGLALSLFVDKAVIERLRLDDPHERLHGGNLVDFCTALEGVSHFLYLLWNASRDHPVRQVEMEMQAEVDKYIAVADLLTRQRPRELPEGLHNWLFSAPSFDATLAAHERVRYEDANYYAARYCYFLEQQYLRSSLNHPRHFSEEVRQFYRLPFDEKLRRIRNPQI